MEPKSPTPIRGPELPSVVTPDARETAGAFPGPETHPGRTIEQQEQAAESAPSVSEASVAQPVTLPVPVTQPVVVDDTTATAPPQVTSGSPAIASDDELIEREWVDKAKKVITETRDDPYAREQRVSQLQEDYLWKRYGRQLKSSQ